MAQTRPSLLGSILRNIIRSILPKTKPKIVGKDDFGNTYYEIPADVKEGRKVAKRWYETEKPEDWEKEIPVQWEAWLRRRRTDPPTEEEIQNNYVQMLAVKQKADELEGKQNLTKKIDPSETEKETSEFPQYSEYELFPGEKDPIPGRQKDQH